MFKDKKTAMVGTLVVALFLSLLTLMTPGKALAEYECHLFVVGETQGRINGGSTRTGREGSFDILAWSVGQTLQITPTTTGQYTSNFVIQDLKVTMKMGKGTPKLFNMVSTGEMIKEAVMKIDTLERFGRLEHTFTIILVGVRVSSFLQLGNSKSTEARPVEEVIFKLVKGSVIKYIWEIDGITTEYRVPN